MSNECEVTSNCPGLLECYEENDFRDEVFFCDCSNRFGWKGLNCTEESATTYYVRSIIILYIPLLLFVFITTSKTLFIGVKLKFKTKVKFTDQNVVFWVK